ncbi:MAG TPA: VWA domain-containing protein [Candidatus Acidoferrales bacterium]|nr:VWA domain-containing protein [Candidatus Acidoferrales bacterium]
MPKRIIGAVLCMAALGTWLGPRVFSQGREQAQITVSSRPYFPGPVLHVRANEVPVHVVVRDHDGKPVSGLNANDFRLYDDGKLQRISDFSVETAPGLNFPAQISAAAATPSSAPAAPPPSRFIALFFDDRDMANDKLVTSRWAAETFVSKDMSAGDHVGIFTASGEAHLDFTNNQADLLAALKQLRPHTRAAYEKATSCPQINVYQAFLIARMNDIDAVQVAVDQAETSCCIKCPRVMLEALAQRQADETLSLAEQFSQAVLGSIDFAIESLARMPGRRVLVLVSPGFWNTSLQPQQDKLADDALGANVVINSLDAKGLVAEPPGGNLSDGETILTGNQNEDNEAESYENNQTEMFDDVLSGLAQSTGGQFFHNNNDLTHGLREMAAVPAVSYTLGFSPVKPVKRLHKLKVALSEKSRRFTIEARKGYFPTDSAANDEAALEKINHEVLAAGALANVPVSVKAETGRLDTGGLGVGVELHVDVRNLPFQKRDERHREKLLFVVALLDANGRFVAGRLGTADLALKNSGLAALAKDGLEAHLVVPAAAGDYQLREVVEECVGGKMFASSRNIAVR